jgi:DNA-binding response OmpR family regulator
VGVPYHPDVDSTEVLVVEDDVAIGRSLARALEGEGYEVSWTGTGESALTMTTPQTALVILDLGLPDMDGLEVCRRLRQRTPAPQVLMLTARGEEADIVLGLDVGADDYLVKPFRLAELLARVRTCLRRSGPSSERVVVGDLTLDAPARRVLRGDEEVELRPKEFDLLVALVGDVGTVVPRSRLMAEVWDTHWHGSTKTLDIHIWALRRKLDTPGGPSRITTIRGVGYRFEPA